MNQFIQKHKKAIAGIAASLLIAGILMSFQNTPFGPIDKLDSLTEQQDTIPEKIIDREGNMSMKDFDKLILDIDRKGIKMQQEIATIDFDKMHHDITASLNKVDFDKIKIDIDKALKEIDFAKIEQGVKSALKEIEWNKLNNDVKLSLQDAKKEIEKINMEELKKQMEKAKAEIEKSKNEIRKINVDEIMKNANAGIAKATDELRLKKEMFDTMEKEGLINQRDGFTIEFKDKDLIINGKKQSEAIRDKYLRFIKGDSFKITIIKE